MTALPVARGFSGAQRALALRLLGARLPQPQPQPQPFRHGHGPLGRLDARLRDGAGWRGVAAAITGLPIALVKVLAIGWWARSLYTLTMPAWWLMFRNHPAGTHLRPVDAGARFVIATWPGTWAAAALGAAMLLLAPWFVRGVVLIDLRIVRWVSGPGAMAERVGELERSRAEAVNEAAALVRQIERNLHDGAQTRLATLALHLGMAKDKLSAGDPAAIAAARELVDVAHAGAREALAELRDLSSGLHPPVLDNGLGPALQSLATASAIPVRVRTDLQERPSPAIETIAYFCAAELLANAIKHSSANLIEIDIDTTRPGVLRLRVSDDGRGGADPSRGTGLDGLRQRVSTVDGALDVSSPPGGPTSVTVELPMRMTGGGT
jgi:signal transduction histidine kinase